MFLKLGARRPGAARRRACLDATGRRTSR